MKTAKCSQCGKTYEVGTFFGWVNDELCQACFTGEAPQLFESYIDPISSRSDSNEGPQRIDEHIKAVNGDYLVIPFIGKIKSGFFSSENAETVSRQLQSLINRSKGGSFTISPRLI